MIQIDSTMRYPICMRSHEMADMSSGALPLSILADRLLAAISEELTATSAVSKAAPAYVQAATRRTVY